MDTALLDNWRFLARYNSWFNQRLYDACEQLPEEERRRDRGAFFGSIHGTLNHIVWGDQLWLQRFAAQGDFPSLGTELLAVPAGAAHATLLHEDWAGLREQRRRLDEAIEQWVREMPAEFSLRTLSYANTRGERREHAMWKGLTHFFNHQTHHRGQVTALLAQAGVDPGVTDMIVLAHEE